jgi:predicted permease
MKRQALIEVDAITPGIKREHTKMNEWFAVLNPLSFLAFLVLLGYIAEKTGYVSGMREKISRLVTHITLPALVIVSLSAQDIQQVPFFDIFTVMASGMVAISSLIIINYSLGKLLRVPVERQLIHSFLGSFGNVIFLGYPFIYFLFGETGLLYAIIFSMVNELIIWTFGAYMLNYHSQINQHGWSIKYLFNPNTISFFIGISMVLLGLRLPSIIHAPMERLGAATTPLSMMFIGAILAGSSFTKAIKFPSIWSVCLTKMILMPIVFIIGFKLFFPLFPNVSAVILSVIVLQIAMPSQVNLSVLADRYRADPEYAAQTIFITTLVSSITLPAMYFVCMYMFP